MWLINRNITEGVRHYMYHAVFHKMGRGTLPCTGAWFMNIIHIGVRLIISMCTASEGTLLWKRMLCVIEIGIYIYREVGHIAKYILSTSVFPFTRKGRSNILIKCVWSFALYGFYIFPEVNLMLPPKTTFLVIHLSIVPYTWRFFKHAGCYMQFQYDSR